MGFGRGSGCRAGLFRPAERGGIMQVMRRALATAALVAFVTATPFGQARSADHWVATWTTAVVARPAVLPPAAAPAAPPAPNAPAPPPPPITPSNQTLRQIVHTSIAGARARVVLANTFGTTAMNIGGASIAVRDRDAAIVPASGRKLTGNGSPAFRIPAGAPVRAHARAPQVPPPAGPPVGRFVPHDP